jgi:superfamily II DNA/RNA helicase
MCLLQLADMLAAQGIANVLYHKNIPKEERDAALAAFADTAAAAAAAAAAGGGAGGNVVMVSTDAAARGIDLPDVTHVVQVGVMTEIQAQL